MQTQPLNGLLERLAELTGRRPGGAGAYEASLTHPSFVNESGQELPSNQRLEFLGDAVLQLVTSDYIFRRHPHLAEGEMTRLRASAVREESLAAAARRLGLGAYLRLGRGEEGTGGRDRNSVLADAFESVVGALFLDQGLEAAQALVIGSLEPILEAREARPQGKDPKTELQEYVQRWSGGGLAYRLVSAEGPDHDKRFHVVVAWREQVLGEGEGRSKKEAEQRAAEAALHSLSDNK